MDSLVTIYASYSLPDVAILKGRLENDGIHCYIKDEYVMQTNSAISNGIGGVKLQVKADDVEKALPILKELGYFEEEKKQSKIVQTVDRLTSGIPLLNRIDAEQRIIALVFAIIAIVFIVMFIKTATVQLR
jgi:hypothetical protein